MHETPTPPTIFFPPIFMIHFTPIGPVSADFPHIAELIERARIGYRDEEIAVDVKDDEGKVIETKTEIGRSWYIVADDERVPSTKRRTTGRSYKDENDLRTAANQHRKFCMIKDAVIHLCRTFASTEDVLLAVLEKIKEVKRADGTIVQVGDRVTELWSLSPNQCETAVANMGVSGYTPKNDPLPGM